MGYREPPSSTTPDEVHCFMIRTLGSSSFSDPHGTGVALGDVQHMQNAVNARLQAGYWVRSVSPCALDREHALVTFVLAPLA